jgi:hypothetical protein
VAVGARDLRRLREAEEHRRAMVERLVIEMETPNDSRAMFRVRMDDLILGEGLTAAQAHLLVGEVLDRINHSSAESEASDQALAPRAPS